LEGTGLRLKLGIPKGSLQEATFSLFKRAGFEFRMSSGRSYHPQVNDPELEPLLLRPQEIPRYVEQGILDAGLTGKDWIEDNGSDVVEAAELAYSKATLNPIRVVLAAPNGSAIASARDLEGKRIATEYVRLTERYLSQHGVRAHVEFSWGACEVKVPDLVDAIVVNTETGNSLRAHNLKIVDTLLTSTTRLAVNREAWKDDWKRCKIENLIMLLQGALNAELLVGLKMNVAKRDLPGLLELLPALKTPTLSPLSNEDWVALEIIIPEQTVRDLLPKMKRAGAEGIVEYPLNKVVY
jgi:ATP phosphoribosyltransferase